MLRKDVTENLFDVLKIGKKRHLVIKDKYDEDFLTVIPLLPEGEDECNIDITKIIELEWTTSLMNAHS